MSVLAKTISIHVYPCAHLVAELTGVKRRAVDGGLNSTDSFLAFAGEIINLPKQCPIGTGHSLSLA